MKHAKPIKVIERKLGRHQAMGLAWKEDHLIEIDPRKKPRTVLNTYIHETIHVAAPKMSEARVKKLAGRITEVLWDSGFRQVHL